VADERAGALIVDLSDAKKRRVQVLVRRALEHGWDDATLATKIEQTVGLDARYAVAVENYRQTLVKNGMPKGRARDLAKAYALRLRQHRAGVIARNEVHAALTEAQRRLWTEAQERGDLSRYAVRVTVVHKDERLCVTCRPQGGKRRSLKRDSKGGPPFHPQCRCYEVLEDLGIVKTHPSLVGRGPEQVEISKGTGRLDWSPKSNWVEEAGGLPKYVEDIALALIRERGMKRDRAIAVAINRVKMWAAGGGDVNPDTRAKAAKAVRQWERMKAKRA
jgi:hypothetical protein